MVAAREIYVPAPRAYDLLSIVIEAMASGQSVIGTRIGNVPERVTGKITGRLWARPAPANSGTRLLS